MRIVVTKEHEAEGAFLKSENFVYVSFSSLADYAIQYVGLNKRYVYLVGTKCLRLAIMPIIIRSKFFFLFIGREPTRCPANNYL